jgi:hypothetical protein
LVDAVRGWADSLGTDPESFDMEGAEAVLTGWRKG